MVDVSGATGSGLAALIEKLILLVPEGEPLYPPSDTTNSTRDFQIAEIIREQVYMQASDEVPYRTKVSVDKVGVALVFGFMPRWVLKMTGAERLSRTSHPLTPDQQERLLGALAAVDDMCFDLGQRGTDPVTGHPLQP